MNFAKTTVFALCLASLGFRAWGDDFALATRLLAAARAGDTRQVQVLISNGANVNFVDATGVSLVCTALMNNDLAAVQILQSYGADSSNCDAQVKNFKTKNTPKKTGGLFSGLSTTQSMTLTTVGTVAAIGGVVLLADAFNPSNSNNTPGGSSSGGSGGSSGGGTSGGTAWALGALPYGPSLPDSTAESERYANNLATYSSGIYADSFTLMNNSPNDNYNYLLLMRGYSPLARGYLGMRTLRNPETYAPVLLNDASWGNLPISGGRPVNVALVTENGINADENSSLADKVLVWTGVNADGTLSGASNETYATKYYNDILTVNATDDFSISEDASFDLSGAGTAIHNTAATMTDNMLAKIVGGNDTSVNIDFFGFMPNGQMTIYRTGGGSAGTDYKNYSAILNAAQRILDAANGRSKVDVIANLDVIEPLHETSAKTIGDILSVGAENYQTTFASFVGGAYGANDINNLPATNASVFFNNLGSTYYPLTVFSTGASKTDSNYSGAHLTATFENAAPLVYSNANHLFMSVVAVGAATPNGTIVANSDGNANKFQVSQWSVGSGDDATYYKSRVCGMAGKGSGNIDPWCFASVGLTDEMATAAAAGAAGVLRSAFYYMTSPQIFTLLALTADGPFLSRTLGGINLSDPTDTTHSTLISYLQGLYELPNEYQVGLSIDNYLDRFQEVFGYGVINLERATTPGTKVYFYSSGNIVSTGGNAYWRAATNTGLRASSAVNLGGVSISTSVYDILESVDGSMSLPRIWENNVSFDNGGRHALYMGDVLADLKTRADTDEAVQFGNFRFALTRSSRTYNDGMGGLDNMRLGYSHNNWDLTAEYQRYLTDRESRFYGMSNPILNLASNAVSGGANYRLGNWSFGARAFSGAITDEGLLQNDPTVSAAYEPMRLGLVSGAGAALGWQNARYGLTTSFGAVRESNTVLGAYAMGLLDIDATDTNYVDIDAFWRVSDAVRLRARATFAHSTPDAHYEGLMALSALSSNAFALSADAGNVSFGVSLPLAVTAGHARASYADYDIVEDENGHYSLAVRDMGTRRIDIVPHSREVRLNAMYRHSFGEFTDGALGFIYRINPNNTRDFGNESVLMLKLTHALGI